MSNNETTEPYQEQGERGNQNLNTKQGDHNGTEANKSKEEKPNKQGK